MPAATTDPPQMQRVFDVLRLLLAEHEGEMIVVHDTSTAYYLNTPTMTENKQPLFFAGIEIKKNYVSFHLFPVYMYPELLEGIGDLRKRMQGKSCFNFRKIDDAQMEGLRSLVQAGYDRYHRDGLIG